MNNPRPAQKQHADFDPHSKSTRISIHALKPSHFRPAHKTTVTSDPPHENQGSYDPHTEPNATSISHTRKNQVRLDSNTQIKAISISTLKSSQLRCPGIKTKSILIQTL